MRILADASLPGLIEAFPKPFELSVYTNQNELQNLLQHQDILLCRSTLKVNAELLANYKLSYVATASSGTDHIDKEFLASKKIQLLDAKGSNASSVADYVQSCLAWLEVEKIFKGRRVGIIGMGKVGKQVSLRLNKLGFELIAFDPLKALNDASFTSTSFDELLTTDILCIHAELHNGPHFPTVNLIDKTVLAALKPGCIVINAARGGIVDEAALLASSNPITYCTDVFANEPNINPYIVDKALICTPHIAGHSLEAKYAAVTMISEQLHELLDLVLPKFKCPEKPQNSSLNKDLSWQHRVLSIYNPLQETALLKQAKDKQLAFLTVRKNHQFRHAFELYR